MLAQPPFYLALLLFLPPAQEPHYFTRKAGLLDYLRRSCSIEGGCAETDSVYIRDVLRQDAAARAGGEVAAFEASADYAKAGLEIDTMCLEQNSLEG